MTQMDGGSDALTYSPCAEDALVGGFVVEQRPTFTAVQGQVSNGVRPNQISEEVAAIGACSLRSPPTLFCDPQCTGATTCAADGTCVPLPENVSVGTVSVQGLAVAVEMTASAPVYFYTNPGTLPQPAFAAGDPIMLAASGDTVAGFSLRGLGIDPLVTSSTSVPLQRGAGVPVSWTAPSATRPVRIELNLNIANHGGTPGWIACTVEDTGTFTIPAALSDRLLDQGFSGFPSLAITRRSVESTQTAAGCVHFEVKMEQLLDVEIEGLISCSDNQDCPGAQQCQADLTCG